MATGPDTGRSRQIDEALMNHERIRGSGEEKFLRELQVALRVETQRRSGRMANLVDDAALEVVEATLQAAASFVVALLGGTTREGQRMRADELGALATAVRLRTCERFWNAIEGAAQEIAAKGKAA